MENSRHHKKPKIYEIGVQNKIFNDETYERWNKIQDDYNKILLSIDRVRLN